MKSQASVSVPKKRRLSPEQRRQAILKAGMDVFAAQGFAASKLDSVADQAGVAKGTIYLHFKDKQDLFEQIILEAIGPILTRLDSVAQLPDMPTDILLAKVFQHFRTHVLETNKKDIIRLVMTEGPRFPAIATFYHREVISKFKALLSAIVKRGIERGENIDPALEQYPHLIVAPLLMSVIWDGLFADIDPLNVAGMLEAHQKLLIQG
ncbi:MAG: TetR/AcrR family transcriptional regulator [Alphaproteobacteria bacterium]|nr:TetR/AcrR family transcriptional regulator [Alphaproteobacteria bacterium]